MKARYTQGKDENMKEWIKIKKKENLPEINTNYKVKST
jgi:hypothetical protein